MILCELHSDDVETLHTHFYGDPQTRVHYHDAYHALKTFLPPKERRGLVLIDPPFEVTDEFERMNAGLTDAFKRWKTGVYALWFPIKHRKTVERFYESIAQHGLPFLKVEFSLKAEKETGLNACGMVIINPPWKLEKTLNHDILPAIAEAIGAHWLVRGFE